MSNISESPYEIIEKVLKNAFQEVYPENDEWRYAIPKLATYANIENTWTGGLGERPQILDYIFYQNSSNIDASVESIFLTIFKAEIDGESKSVSDHEGITATIKYR